VADRHREAGGVTPADSLEARQDQVYRRLVGVMDPEVGLSIVKLGLVYDILIDGDDVTVVMTMTTPACPLGGVLTRDVERRVGELPWVAAVAVRIVWEPKWTPAMIR
jgi:metal-sulfur cluster biosynthetic enzyme